MSIEYILVFSSILFSVGLLGFLVRRNLIYMFISIELMLTASVVNFMAFNTNYAYATNLEGKIEMLLKGQVFAIFVIMSAAAEAAVGVAILVSTYRLRQTVYTDEWKALSCRIQSGDIRHYAFGMVIGVLLLVLIGTLF